MFAFFDYGYPLCIYVYRKHKGMKDGEWLKQQLVNVLRVEAHNMRHYRDAFSLMPGQPMKAWLCADAAAGFGHLALVEALHKKGRSCGQHGADWAAENGHLEIVQYLSARGVHCTERGAARAASNGHYEVTQHLRTQGIRFGADGAARMIIQMSSSTHRVSSTDNN